MRFLPEKQETGEDPEKDGTVLYDLQTDPYQLSPLKDEGLIQTCREAMSRLMREEDAPPEQWQRLSLQRY